MNKTSPETKVNGNGKVHQAGMLGGPAPRLRSSPERPVSANNGRNGKDNQPVWEFNRVTCEYEQVE